MGYSTALLVISLAAAAAVLFTSKCEMPRSPTGWLASAGAMLATVLSGMVIVGTRTSHGVFGMVHALYLLGVVAGPIVLGCWAFTAWRKRTLRVGAVVAGSLGLLAAGCGVWGTHIEPDLLVVDTHELASPAIGSPLRVGVLSDMQTPNVGDHERDAVARLLAQVPDLVLVPGDLYQGAPATIAANRSDFVDLLAELVDSVELVVVVSGDADEPGELESIASDAGATFLDNRTIDRTIAGVELRIAGVEVHGRHPERSATLAGLDRETGRLTLLLSHRPGVVFDLDADAHVDLVVSGHTHGGQVAVPFIGPIVTFSAVPRSLAAGGLGDVGGVTVYVSTGVGLERRHAPQVRFGVRPSIGIIDIVPTE